MKGKTGTTGRATLRCLVKFRFPWSLLENSALLGAANLLFIMNYLNYFGLLVVSFTVEATEFLSPANRDRQYLLVIPWTDGAFDQTTDDFIMPAFVQEFLAFLNAMKRGVGNVDDILFSKSDHEYCMWHQGMVADRYHMARKDLVDKAWQATKQVKKKQKTEKCVEEWEADHLDAFRLANMQWPPDISSDAMLQEAVSHLTRRHQELAYFFTHRPEAVNAPTDRTFHDLNPSIRYSLGGLNWPILCIN